MFASSNLCLLLTSLLSLTILNTASAARASADAQDNPDPQWINLEPGIWGVSARYALLLPTNFDAYKEYPVLLALPPGDQDDAMALQALNLYWKQEALKRNWVVITPSTSGKPRSSDSLIALERIIADVRNRILVESGKFHLAGVSTGGCTAFALALRTPENFKSLTLLPGFLAQEDLPKVSRLKNIPITLYVGSKDTLWLTRAKESQHALTQAGVKATLVTLPTDEHVIRSLTQDRLFDSLNAAAPQTPLAYPALKSPAQIARLQAQAWNLLDQLHLLASKADEENYFALFAPDARFLGTDKNENWTIPEFRQYAHQAFSTGRGWTYRPTHRSLHIDDQAEIAWFEEQLHHDRYGLCRGSGVLKLTPQGWKIQQYILSLPIPNPLISQITTIIQKTNNTAE